MYGKIKEHLQQELTGIKEAGLYKNERIITTPQRANIKLADGRDVLNFCANNYLGLSDNQRLIDAATKAMETHGYGMSSVRFICGTQDLHKELEAAISDYFKTEVIVTPVTASPLIIDHWIGAAPRYFGKRDACTLIQSYFGISRIAFGKICPNAATTIISGSNCLKYSIFAVSFTFSG